MARSKSVRRRTAPAPSVASSEDGNGVADTTVLDTETQMDTSESNIAAGPVIEVASESIPAIDIEPNDVSLFEDLDGDDEGDVVVNRVTGDESIDSTEGAAEVPVGDDGDSTGDGKGDADVSQGDSAVGTDSSNGTDSSFQSDGTGASTDADSTTAAVAPASGSSLFESVSLISDSVGRAVKTGLASGVVVDSEIVSELVFDDG